MRASSNAFLHVIESFADGTQPDTNEGTTITPGNNTYGSYASIISGSSVTDDVYAIEICFNSGTVDSTARDGIATIGFDPAGGTSFTDKINHLLWSCCGNMAGLDGGPVWYRFPLFIKAGTSIGCKASVNNATVGTVKCFIRLFCRPTHPELVRAGSFVRTFGEVTASSRGTSVTPGGGSEGSYVQLGSSLAEDLWFWEVGMGVNNATFTRNVNHVDIAVGDASNKRRVIADHVFHTSQIEHISKPAAGTPGHAAAGSLVYGRIQSGENVPMSGYSLAAYGVGG